MNKFVVAVLGLSFLSACSPLHYENGKSLSDVPANANAIYLKDVYMVARWKSAGENDVGVKNDPPREENPSQNDQEVAALVKSTALRKLSGLGYTTVENAEMPANMMMKFFVDYQPEAWPVAGRTVIVTGRVYTANGTPVFTFKEHAQNSFGIIGAAAGDSRDEMVVSVTEKLVDETVAEVRKGTKRP